MATKKKSPGNQTRPAKKGGSQPATGSRDPRTGRGGRRHEWDKKRLTAARERLNLAKLDGTPDEIARAQAEVEKHLAAAKVSRERKRKEESQTKEKTAAAAPAPAAKPAPAPAAAAEPEEEPNLPFGRKRKRKRKAPAPAPAPAAGKPSSWKRIADAIGSFFGKKKN